MAKTKEHKDRFLKTVHTTFPDPSFEGDIVDELSLRPRRQPSADVVAQHCAPDPRIALYAGGYAAVTAPLSSGGRVPRHGGAK